MSIGDQTVHLIRNQSFLTPHPLDTHSPRQCFRILDNAAVTSAVSLFSLHFIIMACVRGRTVTPNSLLQRKEMRKNRTGKQRGDKDSYYRRPSASRAMMRSEDTWSWTCPYRVTFGHEINLYTHFHTRTCLRKVLHASRMSCVSVPGLILGVGPVHLTSVPHLHHGTNTS